MDQLQLKDLSLETPVFDESAYGAASDLFKEPEGVEDLLKSDTEENFEDFELDATAEAPAEYTFTEADFQISDNTIAIAAIVPSNEEEAERSVQLPSVEEEIARSADATSNEEEAERSAEATPVEEEAVKPAEPVKERITVPAKADPPPRKAKIPQRAQPTMRQEAVRMRDIRPLEAYCEATRRTSGKRDVVMRQRESSPSPNNLVPNQQISQRLNVRSTPPKGYGDKQKRCGQRSRGSRPKGQAPQQSSRKPSDQAEEAWPTWLPPSMELLTPNDIRSLIRGHNRAVLRAQRAEARLQQLTTALQAAPAHAATTPGLLAYQHTPLPQLAGQPAFSDHSLYRQASLASSHGTTQSVSLGPPIQVTHPAQTQAVRPRYLVDTIQPGQHAQVVWDA